MPTTWKSVLDLFRPRTKELRPCEEPVISYSVEDYDSEEYEILDGYTVHPAKILPEGWNWHYNNDGSGSLQSPSGEIIVSYDLAPFAGINEIEYSIKGRIGWDIYDGLFAKFQQYAEEVVNRSQAV